MKITRIKKMRKITLNSELYQVPIGCRVKYNSIKVLNQALQVYRPCRAFYKYFISVRLSAQQLLHTKNHINLTYSKNYYGNCPMGRELLNCLLAFEQEDIIVHEWKSKNHAHLR